MLINKFPALLKFFGVPISKKKLLVISPEIFFSLIKFGKFSSSKNIDSIQKSEEEKEDEFVETKSEPVEEKEEEERSEIKNEYSSIFSEKLVQEVHNNIKLNKQVILFRNRRGYSPTLLCKECYRAVKCNTCDFNLNEHKFLNGLLCHLCGTKYSYPEKCDHCGTRNEYIPIGPGVERIQEEISSLVPNAKVQKEHNITAILKVQHQKLILIEAKN